MTDDAAQDGKRKPKGKPDAPHQRANDAEFVALVLADAAMIGDEAAATRHGVSVRTVERYRSKAKDDEALAASVGEKKAAYRTSLRDELIETTRAGLTRMRTLLETETDLHKAAGAVKIASDALGALQIREAVLPEDDGRQHHDGPRADRAGEAAREDAGGPGSGFAH